MPYVSERTKNRWRNPHVRGVAWKAAKFVGKTVAGAGATSYGGSGLSKYLFKRDRGRSAPGVQKGRPIVIGKGRRGGAPRRRRPNVTSAGVRRTAIVPRNPGRVALMKRYPQVQKQRYYLTSPSSYLELESGVDGSIRNPDMLYSKSSASWKSSSIMLFNVSATEAHWIPRTDVITGKYRTGYQLCGLTAGDLGTVTPDYQNDSFLWYNTAASTGLTSDKCPMWNSALAENAVGAYAGGDDNYTIPNSVLKGLDINIKVCNPLIVDQKFSVKVIKLNNGVAGVTRPGTFGDTENDGTAVTNTAVNAHNWTDNQQFTQLWCSTIRMRGLRAGTPLRYHNFKKSLSLEYIRSAYRKSFNADNLAALGTQIKPSYVLSDDATMFNSVYIVCSSLVMDDEYIADVQVDAAGPSTGLPAERLPQIAEYPPKGIDPTIGPGTYKEIAKGAQFGISGSIGVEHRVEALRRSVGGATVTELNSLQRQIDDLKRNNSGQFNSGQCELGAPHPLKKLKTTQTV